MLRVRSMVNVRESAGAALAFHESRGIPRGQEAGPSSPSPGTPPLWLSADMGIRTAEGGTWGHMSNIARRNRL
ncbi:MAG: hypothetical protein QME82_07285, partial [Bacillota bacterium]|nr:hypothetical protein [Bacillota bacterium]